MLQRGLAMPRGINNLRRPSPDSVLNSEPNLKLGTGDDQNRFAMTLSNDEVQFGGISDNPGEIEMQTLGRDASAAFNRKLMQNRNSKGMIDDGYDEQEVRTLESPTLGSKIPFNRQKQQKRGKAKSIEHNGHRKSADNDDLYESSQLREDSSKRGKGLAEQQDESEDSVKDSESKD